MSEDARSTKARKVLRVANPDSGDSEDASEEYRRLRPNGHAYPYRRPHPPPSSNLSYQQHKPTASQPTISTADFPSVNNSSHFHQQPPLSPDSAGSQAAEESTPPPSTPTPHAPSNSLDLSAKSDSPSKTLPTPDSITYSDRNVIVNEVTPTSSTSTSRKGKFLATLKAPFGSRPPRAVVDNNSPRRHRASPTALLQDPNPSPSSYASSSTTSTSVPVPEKVIFVTADSERYTTVDISGAKTGPQIKELIFTKLNVYSDEEQAPLSIYQTEIGSFAIGAALTDDHLLALCRDHGDSKGNLKFFVSHASAFVHEPPSLPPPPSEIVPPVLPHHMVTVGPLRPKRRSRSRNGSFSSTSEHLPEVAAGYEADLDNPERETSRTTVRPSQHQIASSLPLNISHPPSPRRRPSLHYQRPSSPLIQSPESSLPTSNAQAPDRSWAQRKEERYPHVLQGTPVAPALSPNRPSFSLHDEPSSLAVPNSRLLHVRSGSDAGADREMALRASEQLTDNLSQQFRSRDPPSINKLRTDPSRENLTQMKELRPSRRTFDDDDASWELVPSVPPVPPGGDQETTRPRLSRGSRQPTSRFRPTSPYTARHNIGNPPSQPPPAPPQSETRPPRPARVPLPGNIFVTWKGEEGGSRKTSSASAPANGLRKNFTKSMDNLKLSSPNSQSSRRNMPQLPINRPTGTNTNMNYSHSNLNLSMPGGAKSYDPPRGTFIRPLPAHGNSPDIAPTASTQYSSRALPYGSNITSPSEPFPRPQSATGESLTSPTRGYSKLQSPVHGPTLEAAEPARSPRAVSPHRAFHSPGVPGPRPRPTNHSDRSDRSSDIQSGPETSNTTPPRSPISPQSPRYDPSEKTPLVIEPSSPLSLENPINVSTARGSDLTIRQEDTIHFAKMLDGMDHGTFIGRRSNEIQPEKQNEPQNSTIPPPPLTSLTSPAGTYVADDDGSDESETGGGTWIVRPEPPKSNIRPPLKVQIENTGSASSSGSRTLVDARANISQQMNTQPVLAASYHAPANGHHRVPSKLDQLSSGRPGSTFVDTDSDSWAPRPPPENIYERLEEFFSKQILDKPVFEAASGDTSPTSSEPVAVLPPPPVPVANVPNVVVLANDKGRIKAKKSIRVVAQEHKKRIDRTSRADPASFANANMLRKRNTKLWGSRLEEVTTAARGASSLSQPESPGQPTTFKWVRGELIGKGTYGRVYLALNATTGEMIAVKQVELPQTASDKNDSRQHTVVQALKMESETLKDLDHPNIVQYLGFEETPTNLSIFLEYVPGGSVGSCLHKHGKFDDNVTRSFTAQILGGLEYLHSKGILHRDLKADNILVEMSGTCKISDFGISKRTEDAHGGAFTAMQGTVFWMAPEVINTQKKGYNFKIDIWSVGCVVLEMWAGMRPWMGEEMVAVMFKLYQSKLPPPVPEDVVLSEDADDFRQKCFAINPEERPSAAELRKHPYLTLPPGWVFTGFT